MGSDKVIPFLELFDVILDPKLIQNLKCMGCRLRFARIGLKQSIQRHDLGPSDFCKF